MRAWRKLESGIVTSERLSKVSDSAKWLFTLLLAAQDDEGKYPWTPTMIRSLTVTTTWGVPDCESLLSELRVANVAELREGFVVLRNGAEKNGTPANSKRWVMLYPATEPISESNDESPLNRNRLTTESEPTVQSRVEKSRVELSEPSASDLQAQKEKLPPEKTADVLPNSCQEWQERIRAVDTQQNQVKVLVDMVVHHYPHPPPRSGDHAAALLKQTRDPPYAVKLLWDAMGANPAGNIFVYAAGIYSRRTSTSRKVNPRRAHEQGASTGRPWEVIGDSRKDDSGEQAV